MAKSGHKDKDELAESLIKLIESKSNGLTLLQDLREMKHSFELLAKPAYSMFNISFDDFFSLVNILHRLIDSVDMLGKDRANYLRLEALGCYPPFDGYAASFDAIIDDNEWYEPANIATYPYAAMAKESFDAIRLAALEVIDAMIAKVEKDQ